MSKKNNIEDIFRDAFPERNYKVDAAGWDQMSSMLDAQGLTRSKRRRRGLLWAFSFISIGVIGAATLWTMSEESARYSETGNEIEAFTTEKIASEKVSDNKELNREEYLVEANAQNIDESKPTSSPSKQLNNVAANSASGVQVSELSPKDLSESTPTIEKAPTSVESEGVNFHDAARTSFNFDEMALVGAFKHLNEADLPQAQVLDLSILGKQGNKSSYYKPWRKSFYLLGGVHHMQPIATTEEQKVSSASIDVNALQYEIGVGSYFEKGKLRFGIGLHHNSIVRDAQFESRFIKDTTLTTINTRKEIADVDSTFLGYVPNKIWDPVNEVWVNDGVRPDWQVDTTYNTISDTSYVNTKDTSYSSQSGQLRQQYLEVPLSLAYVWSKGRVKVAVQGGYSLGYLVAERIKYSSDNNNALQQEYTSDKSLMHFLVFNPEISYAVGSRTSIFAQPTYRHRLSGGSIRALEPGQLGLRFGLMYDF